MHVTGPPCAIDVACMLHFAAGLELVAKSDAEWVSVDTFKTESEAAHTCEKFNRVELNRRID
ncbi:protein of unknown function [Caballeronia sp. S22]